MWIFQRACYDNLPKIFHKPTYVKKKANIVNLFSSIFILLTKLFWIHFSLGIFSFTFSFLLISQIFLFFLESSLTSFSLLVFIFFCHVLSTYSHHPFCKGNCLWTLSPFYIFVPYLCYNLNKISFSLFLTLIHAIESQQCCLRKRKIYFLVQNIFFFININSFSNVSREWVNETPIHVYNLTYTVKQLRATLFPYSKTSNANSLTNKKTLVSFLLSLSPVQNYWRKFNWKSSKKKLKNTLKFLIHSKEEKKAKATTTIKRNCWPLVERGKT